MQMKEDKHLLAVLIGIYIFVLAIVVLSASSHIIVVAAKEGVNQEWLGFAGSIVSGLVTVGAGVAAWIAAQRTIRSAQAIAERREEGTYQVAQAELLPKIELFVRYWRIIEHASKSGPDVKRNGEILIRSMTEHGISDNWLDEMRKISADLNPIRRRQLIDIVGSLRWVREQLKRPTDESNRSVHFYLLNLRTMLSHFERFLQAFDSSTARRFEHFTKSPIDHRTFADHTDPLVENFEATGNVG